MESAESTIGERRPSWILVCVDSLSTSEVFSILHSYEDKDQGGRLCAIKEGKRSVVSSLSGFRGKEQIRVCLKHYRFLGLIDSLVHMFFPCRAMSSFRAAREFRQLGVATAKPLAVLEKRRCGIPIESILIMEDISHCCGFSEYIEKQFPPLLSKNLIAQKRTFIKEFADYLKSLQGKGIYQADFKTTNIFVKETLSGERTFCLIDLDRVMFVKRLAQRRKVKNLVQINTSLPGQITLTDRLRFYHAYRGRKYLTAEDKIILRAIIRLSERRNPRWHSRFGMNAALIRTWE